MNDKGKIIDAWIMVEHLSEGDIDIHDKSNIKLADNDEDYYSFFNKAIDEGIKSNNIGKNGGFVIYFGIFAFEEVIEILRQKYNFAKTNEDIDYGNKFRLALYFDKDLNFLPDMLFCTESYYIYSKKDVPDENTFREYEKGLRTELEQLFEDSADDSEKFNHAIKSVISKYSNDIDSCRYKLLKNVETSDTNLHSFFIDDLESAKSINTDILNSYFNPAKLNRYNLDVNPNANGETENKGLFENILAAKQYPLGRFPSKTEFALTFMQQVAVNLAIGYDNSQIRSVNGPPGTGKTTLLKDIFAELIVRQAKSICSLQDKNILQTEIYWEKAKIGKLPDEISENEIVVASSNNGAVQNIVNDLPLLKDIDSELREMILDADYFTDIANNRFNQEDESEPSNGAENFEKDNDETMWGLFSCEGGSKDNTDKILAKLDYIFNSFDEYEPNPDIYHEFNTQYDELNKTRSRVQRISEISKSLNEQNRQLTRAMADFCTENSSLLQGLVKPGILASKIEKNDYKQKKNSIENELFTLKSKEIEIEKKERDLNKNIQSINNEINRIENDTKQLDLHFESWSQNEQTKINTLKTQIHESEEKVADSKIIMLDMNQDYSSLQQSNPWFDTDFRRKQSELFITAIKVRKQFIYENKKNLNAAKNIWRNQQDYLDRKELLAISWHWINFAIPVISSTFASFGRMCKYLTPGTIGNLFVDEAGQAVPQAAVGAIFRSKKVMVVGDPSQIKPVLTLDSNVLRMLRKHYDITEEYLSDNASVQALVDKTSQYGYYRSPEKDDDSWVGIPLWVHRRCLSPMFEISNEISYDGKMVLADDQKNNLGKCGWFDIQGKANNKYVKEQGDFLKKKIEIMAKEKPAILDKKKEDIIYVITPFRNVAYQLAKTLNPIGFTRYDKKGKPTNIGTIHTFQGKEAPIVFLVLGADKQSSGAARWAVSEPNMMNVAATRAKKVETVSIIMLPKDLLFPVQ